MAEDPLGRRPQGERAYDPSLDAAAEIAAERRLELEAAAAEAARSARRRTLLTGSLVVLAILVLAGTASLLTTRRRSPGGAAASDIFSAGGLAVPGAVTAQFSPDGEHLAVLRGGGSVGLVESGRFRPLVPEEATISAFAWYGGNRLMLQEGPISTGQLAAIALDGSSQGIVTLEPDVAPGTGLAASPDRRTIVLVGTIEPIQPVGQATTDLFAVDVGSGRTRRLTTSPDAESRPVFVDERRVAYTARADGAERVEVLDLEDGTTARLAQPAAHGAVLTAVRGEVVWWDGGSIVSAAVGGEPRRLADATDAAPPVAISPDLRRLVLRDRDADGNTVLRLVPL